jgi:hypothetical protein
MARQELLPPRAECCRGVNALRLRGQDTQQDLPSLPKTTTPYQGSAELRAAGNKWGSWGGSRPRATPVRVARLAAPKAAALARSSSARGASSMGGRGGGGRRR